MAGIPVAMGGADGGLVTGPGQLQYGPMLLGGGTSAGWRELHGWRDLPDASVADSERPQAHGTYAGAVFGGSLVVTYTYILRGSPEDKQEYLDLIERHTPMDGVDRYLTVDDGSGPWFRMARVIGRQVPQDAHFRHGPVECSLQFLCADPRRYSVLRREGTVRLAESSGGLEYSTAGDPVVSTNHVKNPSGEVDATGWGSQAGSNLPASSAEQAWVGSASIKAMRGAGTNAAFGCYLLHTDLPAAGDYPLRLRLWVPSIISTGGLVGIRLGGSGVAAYNVSTDARDQWVEMSLPFTWDGVGTVLVQAYDGHVTSGGYMYVDAMTTSDAPYFDGDTPDTADTVHEWAGAPHASTSTRTFTPAPGLQYPLQYGESSSGAFTARNDGSEATSLVATFHGPLTDPVLTAEDWSLGFNINLADGERLDVDTAAGTAMLNGTADRLYTIRNDSDPLERCLLQPGTTNLTLTAPDGTGRVGVAAHDARM